MFPIFSGRNGSSPIHLAVQMKSIDCIMVLINIGVDLNIVNNMGFTPRFLAHSQQNTQVEKLLAESGAKLVLESQYDAPLRTILDVVPEKGAGSKEIKSNLHDFLHLPSGHTMY